MSKLMLVLLAMGCRDPGELIGDSNVYVDIEATEFSAEGADESDDVTADLLAQVDEDAIAISHTAVIAQCDATWEDVTVDMPQEFHIIIDYGLDQSLSSAGNCKYNLSYRIPFIDVGLAAGVYKISAGNEQTEVDLRESSDE